MFVTFATFLALVYGSETIRVKSGNLMFRIFVVSYPYLGAASSKFVQSISCE